MRRHTGRPAPQWGRRKLVALLAAAAGVAALLLTGLTLAVLAALHVKHDSSHPSGPANVTTRAATLAPSHSDPRDVLAAAPMPRLPLEAAQPAPVSLAEPGNPILVPSATKTGPAHVPTGFPHTPAGALAQLAAIDQSALQSASLQSASTVITAWGSPDGPDAASWSLLAGLSDLLTDTAADAATTPAQVAIVLTPVMGEVKGRVGADFVIPCVDFELDVTAAQTARVAVADCQRMTWRASRWVIDAGSEPATPPSVWPDTDGAYAVGYQDLRWEQR